MSRLRTTPSATVGPYWSIGLTWDDGPHVVEPDAPGAIWIRGRVFDGAGQPLAVGLVETWQADPDGRFDHPDDPRGPAGGDFRGFGRAGTDAEGRYGILTLKPGPVPGPGGATQAPHIAVSVFARGLLNRVVTRMYFADEADANASDPVLAAVPEEKRGTLIAERTDDGYRFDVRLQGQGETAFFDI